MQLRYSNTAPAIPRVMQSATAGVDLDAMHCQHAQAAQQQDGATAADSEAASARFCALEQHHHELEAAHVALHSQLEVERSAWTARECELEAELAAADAASGAAGEAATNAQRLIHTLQQELQSVRADCDGQLINFRQQAETQAAAAERDAQSKAAAQAEAGADLEQQLTDLRAQQEARVSDLEHQLAQRAAVGNAETPVEADSGSEVDGLRQSVKELSEQVQRYAEAAERLSAELEEAHAASASLEEQVIVPRDRVMYVAQAS